MKKFLTLSLPSSMYHHQGEHKFVIHDDAEPLYKDQYALVTSVPANDHNSMRRIIATILRFKFNQYSKHHACERYDLQLAIRKHPGDIAILVNVRHNPTRAAFFAGVLFATRQLKWNRKKNQTHLA